MRCFGILTRRRLAAWAYSPYFYAAAAIFLFAGGFDIWRLMSAPYAFPGLESVLFGATLFWLAAAAFWAGLTMSSFAEAKSNGALESLFTAPVTDTEAVLSEFFAALAAFSSVMVVSGVRVLAVKRFSVEMGPFDPAAFFSSYLFLLFMASFFIALGVMLSTVCRSSAAAGLLSFLLTSAFFFSARFFDACGLPLAAKIASAVSPWDFLGDFAVGIVDTRPLVFFLAGAVLFLFISVRAVESRHWKM